MANDMLRTLLAASMIAGLVILLLCAISPAPVWLAIAMAMLAWYGAAQRSAATASALACCAAIAASITACPGLLLPVGETAAVAVDNQFKLQLAVSKPRD